MLKEIVKCYDELFAAIWGSGAMASHVASSLISKVTYKRDHSKPMIGTFL
jgi:hypothetical protein